MRLADFGDDDVPVNQKEIWGIDDDRVDAILGNGTILIALMKRFCKRAHLVGAR